MWGQVSSRIGTVSVFLALVASLCLNVYLGIVLASRPALSPLPPGGVKVGQDLRSLIVTQGAGKTGPLFGGGDVQPAILYVFSPKCVWCAKDHRNIVEMSTKLADRYKFVALSLSSDGLEEYLAEHTFPFDVRLLVGQASASKGLEVTPQTIVVNQAGVAAQVWVGAALPRVKSDMERFFSVSLPGALE